MYMDSMAGGIYDYLDESTKFSGKSVRLKTLTSHSYNFVMKVHHINQDKCSCTIFRRIGDGQHCHKKVTLHR